LKPKLLGLEWRRERPYGQDALYFSCGGCYRKCPSYTKSEPGAVATGPELENPEVSGIRACRSLPLPGLYLRCHKRWPTPTSLWFDGRAYALQ